MQTFKSYMPKISFKTSLKINSLLTTHTLRICHKFKSSFRGREYVVFDGFKAIRRHNIHPAIPNGPLNLALISHFICRARLVNDTQRTKSYRKPLYTRPHVYNKLMILCIKCIAFFFSFHAFGFQSLRPLTSSSPKQPLHIRISKNCPTFRWDAACS